MIAKCVFCGRDVSTRVPGAYERVTGWVSGQGAKGFKTESHTGDWAHESCISRSKRGLIGQESLLGDAA